MSPLSAELGRPVPEPSWLTERFWAAARDNTLVRPVCSDCGKNFFSPQAACPRCLSESWEYVPSSGRGQVYSFTICHRAPDPAFVTPYVLAIIDLEEGWSMMSNVVSDDPSDVRMGMAVEVDWLPLSSGMVLPVFVPRAAA